MSIAGGQNAVIQKHADIGVVFKGLIDLALRCLLRQGVDHQGIELGVLGLLQPVVLEQAFELLVQILIIPYALDIVSLGHPLDVENRERHSQRAVREHKPCHIIRGANEITLVAETLLEFFAEAFEEVNVLGFLAGKSEQGPDPVIISGELRSRVIHP